MKRKWLGFPLVSVMALTACGNETSEDGENPEDILNQSISAMEDLESYGMDMTSSQSISMDNEEDIEEFEIDTSTEMDMVLDPLSFEQSMTLDLADIEGAEELGEDDTNMTYLSYFHEDDGFFVEDPASDSWMQMENEMMEDFLMVSEDQMNPEEQLHVLEDYVSDVSMEESADNYVITLETEDLDIEEMMEELDGLGMDGMDGMDEMFAEMFDETDIEHLDFQVSIDKETYYQTEAVINLSMTMDMMGESLQTSQESSIIYRDFDEIGDIDIPQDVLDSAEETEEEDLMEDDLMP